MSTSAWDRARQRGQYRTASEGTSTAIRSPQRGQATCDCTELCLLVRVAITSKARRLDT